MVEVHVAGGNVHEGILLDSHNDVVPEPVWEALDWLVPRAPHLGGLVYEVQEPAFALYKASILTKDYGERFANSERQLAQLRRDVADGMTGMAQACDSKTPSRALTPAELEAQTKKAQGQTDKPGVKCTTKTYGGGAAVTVCE